MIGYYVHHQGHGHRQRMSAIAAHLTEPLTVLSSLPRPPGFTRSGWLELPADHDGETFVDPTARGTLHWVPQHHPGLRRRMSMIASWIEGAAPESLVVDVSVEVCTLARLMGVPTVVMAMRGDRSDRPHRMAYDAAHALVAPWSAEFVDPTWPTSWPQKTFHAGAFSRFDQLVAPPRRGPTRPSRVLLLWGSGGDRPSAQLAAARAATPGWTWRVADFSTAIPAGADAVWELLSWADVVVTHAGQNAIAEVAAARAPAVVVADDRPHGEQMATVRVLDRAGLAVGLSGWPEPQRWSELLESAYRRGGSQWARWSPGDGAVRAADFLTTVLAALRNDRLPTPEAG